MNRIYIITICCLISFELFSQETRLIYKQDIKRPIDFSTSLVDTTNFSRFIKPIGYKTWIIKGFDFKRNNEFNKSSTAYFFIGSVNDSTYVVIFDKDQNMDFTNDSIYYSNSLNTTTVSNPLKFDFEGKHILFALNSKSKNRKYQNSVENNLYLTIRVASFRYLYVNSKGDSTDLRLSFRSPLQLLDPNKNKLEVNDIRYSFKDTIRILDENFLVKSFSNYGDTLTILNVAKNVGNGILVGENIEDFEFNDVVLAKNIKSLSFRKKYILLDFWGTWCAPCIKGIPSLKELYEDYKDSLDIVSICWDNKNNMGKLFGFIEKYKMNWYHSFEDEAKKNGFTENFKVNVFPTYILIDENRNILLRGHSDDFPEIKKIISSK